MDKNRDFHSIRDSIPRWAACNLSSILRSDDQKKNTREKAEP